MSALTRIRSVRAVAGGLALVLSAFAAPAHAEGPGPAYLIEPGDAPENSVQMTEPGETPAEVAPEDDAAYDSPPLPDEAPPVQVEGPPEAPAAADDDPRALEQFAPRLEPYGSWTTDPSYGQVWIPDSSIVGSGFSPYLTDGHWSVNESGSQVWMSDYPFGDVVFHYGRWVWTAGAWAWVPGYRYAPAWVAWRLPTDGYGYFGWSPLPPSFVWMNRSPVGISWRGSYYWVFCPGNFVHSPAPSQYVVHSPAEAQAVAPHTRAYVPATPRRGSSAMPVSASRSEMARAAPQQQFAPGYRPVTRIPARASVPNAAVVARARPIPMRGPAGSAAMVHVAMPARVAAPLPRAMNAGGPMRMSPAATRRR